MTLQEQSDYLKRLKWSGPNNTSLDGLCRLQKAHLLNVPFENLDIHLGKKIEVPHTFDKVVTHHRGGFCYELNGLFYELLEELGFTVKRISARAFDKKKGFGPEFDHMAIVATIDGSDYLVDVGFGEFAFFPLKIELNTTQTDPRGNFRIEKQDDQYLVVKKEEDRNVIPQYLFTEIEREAEEFNEMLHYHQTNSNSHFTQKRLCSLPTENGRITIAGNVLKITSGDDIKIIPLKDESEFTKILDEYFGMRL
jgi:N-hydroxyarylamine O-acetyltransferase